MSKSTPCSVAGCDRPGSVRGWCRGHYQRWVRNGEPGPADFRPFSRSQDPCVIDGCSEPARARGWCHAHYCRWAETGETGGPVKRIARKAQPECSVDGCDLPSAVKGWCRGHYKRWWDSGDPGPATFRSLRTDCEVDGCDRPHASQGWCELHYRRWAAGVPIGSRKFLMPPPTFDPSSYGATHDRIRSERGSAATYRCVECGEGAHHWAYQHDDPDQLHDPRGFHYSAKVAHYEPMCRSCHGRFDRDPDRWLIYQERPVAG